MPGLLLKRQYAEAFRDDHYGDDLQRTRPTKQARLDFSLSLLIQDLWHRIQPSFRSILGPYPPSLVLPAMQDIHSRARARLQPPSLRPSAASSNSYSTTEHRSPASTTDDTVGFALEKEGAEREEAGGSRALVVTDPTSGRRGYLRKNPLFKQQHWSIVQQRHSGSFQQLRKQDEEEKRAYEAARRDRGFRSSFKDFRSLLKYTKTVEAVYRGHESVPATPPRDITGVLRKAKETLTSPRPPAPGMEHLRQLLDRQTLADKALGRGKVARRKIRPTLSAEEQRKIDKFLAMNGTIATLPGAEVAIKDMRTLLPGKWLNDEVINFYGVMIGRRAAKAEQEKIDGFLKVHVFTTFFWSKLFSAGYMGVRRWTRKVDLFTKDIIIIPINLGNSHWVCAAINLQKKRFEFYDSMGRINRTILKKLREYIVEERKDKKNDTLDVSEWEDYSPEDVPQQENGFDCGVFTSQFAECLSRRDGLLDFAQENITYFRKKMIYEIGTAELLPGP